MPGDNRVSIRIDESLSYEGIFGRVRPRTISSTTHIHDKVASIGDKCHSLMSRTRQKVIGGAAQDSRRTPACSLILMQR